jgi:PAS domain S-box-containing protein
MKTDGSEGAPVEEALRGGPPPNTADPAEPSEGARTVGAETRERKAAIERGEDYAREHVQGSAPPRDPYRGLAPPGVAHRAFSALAENVRDYAIFLMDTDGIITFWGEGARLIKGWTKDQVEGAHLRVLYPDGGGEDGTAESHLQKAAESGEFTGEGHRVRSDGSTFWAHVALTALRDTDGKLLGFAKTTRDMTARRAGEAAIKASHEAAEEASRMKSLFLATMSHEIRTPINAVMGYTDLLLMELGGPVTQAQHDQLERIRASSHHLLRLVEDALDLSRVEAGRLVVDRARLRIGSAITGALVLVSPQAAKRPVELVDAVSGSSGEESYWGDEERVRQILLNLLGNAIKFTEAGGRITVSAHTVDGPPAGAALEGSGPWVYVRVEDTGRGIPADRLEAIFDPFVQADMSLTRQHGGSGMGLAISQRLARLMGGDLTVRSELEVGSTFFLWLPAAADEAALPAPPQGEAGPAPLALSLHASRDAILAELERILHGYMARLRADPATPGAHGASERVLEGHLASFLSDIALGLGALDLSSGAGPEALRDGTAIRRTIARSHGKQRARLDWGEAEIQREFVILREELVAAVRRRVRGPGKAAVNQAIGVIEDVVAGAERTSLESYRLESRT